MTSVAEALRRGIDRLAPTVDDTARLEARLLLQKALDRSLVWLFQSLRTPISPADLARYECLLKARALGEPLFYLVGQREFYGSTFLVDSRVLIPRAETEVLIELALTWAREKNLQRARLGEIVDVGTGSGALAITLARELPAARLLAVDISADALAVARVNACRHGVAERVSLVQGNLVDWLGPAAQLIIANLPYIPSDEIARLSPELQREPRLALDGGPDGLDRYRELFRQAATVLAPTGVLFAEIAQNQGLAAAGLARASFPGREVKVWPDLEGRDRVVAIGESRLALG
jgi:release factor glutamine methyltransferase